MRTRQLLLGLLFVLPVACGVRPRVVVTQPDVEPASPAAATPAATPSAQRSGEHVVVRGDTLYSIAFRNGLDHHDLARWNAIAAPYTIYPGQRLKLAGPRPTAAAPAPVAGTARPAPAPDQVASAASAVDKPAREPATTPDPTPAVTPVVGTGTTRSADGVTWRWPTREGQIIMRFSAGDPTRQGMKLAGASGDAVVAVADGEVGYSGAGLVGLGELIIIRHGEHYLSAYGHNRKRLVAEGQRVKAGQQIAELGRSGAPRDMLHFEIRKNGKPVDPLSLLPSR